MSASRADARRRRAPLRLTATLLASGLLLAAPGLRAQDPAAQDPARAGEPAAPIPLFPPTVRPGPSGPAPAAPDDLPAAEPQSEPQSGWSADNVEVNRLGELDPDSLGVLAAEHGGLGADAWAGSERAEIEALLRALPAELDSPTLHRLATRLLLSSAQAPAGAPQAVISSGAPTMADAIAAARDTDFLRLRAERLYALGALAGLNRLLAQVPQRVQDPWLAEARVDGLLLAGRDEEACDQVPAGLASYRQSLYWAKAKVFCQVIAGQADQAMLELDLLREQAPDENDGFLRLADAFIAGSADAAADAALTPLTLAMLRRSGGGLPLAAVAQAEPLLLHGIAGLSGGDHVVQAAAVERLVEMGALPGERLAGAYEAFEFTEAELTDALAEAERLAGQDGGGVRARALLYRAANRESLGPTRAEILRAAFLSAQEDGRAVALAHAAVPLMQALAPTAELAWFAPLAARTLYRAGQFERAGAWFSVLRLDGQRHPESAEAYEALRPLQRLAGGPEPLAGDAFTPPQRLRLFVLSRALGQNEDLAWVEAGDSPAEPLERLPRLLALGDAAAAGRRGEAVLLAVAALAPAPAERHPLALGYGVSALAAVGLGGDARALAIEAALAAGL